MELAGPEKSLLREVLIENLIQYCLLQKCHFLLRKKNQILVTDSQGPVPGFRDGYRKEMAKLKFKQKVKRTTTCCLLWVYFIGVEGFTEISVTG